MITAENVSYQISGKQILKNLSLSVEKGSIFGILGPNGAGKSTLLKCLAGFLSLKKGSVSYDGRPLTQLTGAQLACRRAVLTQQTDIGFPISGREVVALGRSALTNGSDLQTDKIVQMAMDLTETTEFADRSLSFLSGGEQQRIHLARVIAQIWGQEDAVLFLDEPTSALDLKHQFQLFEICRKLCAEQGLSVVTVLHDLRLAKEKTDQVLLLKHGEAYAAGLSSTTLTQDVICPLYDITPDQFSI
jgi:heme transport system ATP-binding protein